MKLNADQAAAALAAEKSARETYNQAVSVQDDMALRKWCVDQALRSNSTNIAQTAAQIYKFMTDAE